MRRFGPYARPGLVHPIEPVSVSLLGLMCLVVAFSIGWTFEPHIDRVAWSEGGGFIGWAFRVAFREPAVGAVFGFALGLVQIILERRGARTNLDAVVDKVMSNTWQERGFTKGFLPGWLTILVLAAVCLLRQISAMALIGGYMVTVLLMMPLFRRLHEAVLARLPESAEQTDDVAPITKAAWRARSWWWGFGTLAGSVALSIFVGTLVYQGLPEFVEWRANLDREVAEARETPAKPG